MDKAISINDIQIRLTHERWYHITENHDEMAGYFHDVLDAIENPDYVIAGNYGSTKAIKNYGKNNWLVVIYKEESIKDGFVITAYFISKKPKGKTIWPKK